MHNSCSSLLFPSSQSFTLKIMCSCACSGICHYQCYISLSPTGMMNEAVAVHLDICVPEVICQFLDGPVGSASCAISFSTDPTYANLSTVDSANGTSIANLSVLLSTELQPNTLYHYDGLAVQDSMRIRVQGTLVSSTFITPAVVVYMCTHVQTIIATTSSGNSCKCTSQ